jgi:hypothetical protein
MKKRLVLTLLVLVGICWNVSAQRGSDSPGGEAVEIVDARRTVTALGKQWAVFIAIDEYREWGPLIYPVKDAQEIKNILLEHYYIDEGCVRELYNRDATRSAILSLFAELMDKTGPDDSVFVFHAGHGKKTDDRIRTNAWIPYDGGEDISTQANWLSHITVRSMLDALRARHVFLISDSCFSGDLLYTPRGESTETVVNYPAAYNGKSRQAMSSGASEGVDDFSEFASRLKNTLRNTGTPYLTPDFIYYQIRYVETETVRPLSTIPLLAAIPQSQHEPGGSFLFFRKNPSVPQPDPVQPPAGGTLPPLEPPPPRIQIKPGEEGYFIGSWTADVEYNGSVDTYQITLSANGRCTVKITSDIAQQETTGNWSWDGSMFRLNAVFRNPAIAYQRNIQWVSLVSFGGGNNAFNILGRAAVNGSPVRFTFFRE